MCFFHSAFLQWWLPFRYIDSYLFNISIDCYYKSTTSCEPDSFQIVRAKLNLSWTLLFTHTHFFRIHISITKAHNWLGDNPSNNQFNSVFFLSPTISNRASRFWLSGFQTLWFSFLQTLFPLLFVLFLKIFWAFHLLQSSFCGQLFRHLFEGEFHEFFPYFLFFKFNSFSFSFFFYLFFVILFCFLANFINC